MRVAMSHFLQWNEAINRSFSKILLCFSYQAECLDLSKFKRRYFYIPRGVRLKCYYAFFLVCCGCDTSYIVSFHIQYQAIIYTLSLCRGHLWRVRLAKQDTLTPPGHLVSPLVCRGPWMSTVVLYCWCHSDGASVLLYFTFLSHLLPLPCGAGSTVPREGFDSSVIMPFSWCVVAVTLPI